MGPYVPRLGSESEEHKKYLRSSADPDEHMHPFFFMRFFLFSESAFGHQSLSSPILSSVLLSRRPSPSVSLACYAGPPRC
jgi:hypothetical protein